MSYPKKKDERLSETEEPSISIHIQGFNQCHEQFTKEIKKRADVERLLKNIIIPKCLRSITGKKEREKYVFICCGGEGKPIRTKGLCPHCNSENTEVVNNWKYSLAKAISEYMTGGLE
jgi:Zn finger protein HypA/HybF involved in hydrogenase expression